MQKKEWNKIASQIRFKNFIRVIIKKNRKDPGFLVKRFRLFKIMDQLYEARVQRMAGIKKIMARQMIEQNSIKFEVIEKMNNLANLAQSLF